MGLPEIKITFETRKESLMRRLGRGIVAYVHIAAGASEKEIFSIKDKYEIKEKLTSATESEKIIPQVERMFQFGCKNVIVLVAAAFETLKPDLEREKYNYLAINAAKAEDLAWAKGIDYRAGRKFILITDSEEQALKAKDPFVVCTYPASDKIKVGTPADLAAICAGNNKDRSATYYILSYNSDLTPTEQGAYPGRKTADEYTDKGATVMFNDGVKVKVGRAVTTAYATLSTEEGAGKRNPFNKIRLVDSMNTIEDDIRDNYENNFVGKVLNSYENKMGFINLLNSVYLKGLEGELLEPNANNRFDIDVDAHIKLMKDSGIDISAMTEMDIRTYDTGDALYLAGNLRLLDTMEDLHVKIFV